MVHGRAGLVALSVVLGVPGTPYAFIDPSLYRPIRQVAAVLTASTQPAAAREFLAYLNGLQEHFTMIGGQQSTRSTQHLAELFRLADKARVLSDPEVAATRMRAVLAVHGIGD